jgi:hypothetical protein
MAVFNISQPIPDYTFSIPGFLLAEISDPLACQALGCLHALHIADIVNVKSSGNVDRVWLSHGHILLVSASIGAFTIK